MCAGLVTVATATYIDGCTVPAVGTGGTCPLGSVAPAAVLASNANRVRVAKNINVLLTGKTHIQSYGQ